MLSRPFYFGKIEYGGISSEGKHIPLISKNLFDKVQNHLKVDYSTNKPRKYEFAFTGFIKCSECGGSITAEKHTKYYKKTDRRAEYVYYRCTKKLGVCSQPYLDEEKTDHEIRELVKTVSLNRVWEGDFKKLFAEDENNLYLKVESKLLELTSSLQAVEKKLDKLLESFLDEVVDEESYQLKKNQLLDIKLNLKSKIEKTKSEGGTWLEPLSEFINVSATADKITRAKNKSNDLSVIDKKVGSNYLLDTSHIHFLPRIPADLLAARPIAARKNPTFSTLSE